MIRKEIVRRAIEFDNPPRLPFWIGSFWQEKLSGRFGEFPNDVCDCWEMDRQKAGWFFDNAAADDWGCAWKSTDVKNMGQVVSHPLEDWTKLDSYLPPNPRDPFYFERINDEIKKAADRYVVLTSHFNLIERYEMLRGFQNMMMDFYDEPQKVERVLDMILEYKIAHIDEAARRFGDRVNGIFFTDDWGTQQNLFLSPKIFEQFFFKRYQRLVSTVHGHGWHFILHSCGKINNLLPSFIEIGVDMMNMMQPQTYGIKELGERFAGKIAFLTTADIQTTMPKGNPDDIKQEVKELVKYWSTPAGGLVVFNYGASDAIGAIDEMTYVMFEQFSKLSRKE
jgi:uroporphyrinogen decarboxylase